MQYRNEWIIYKFNITKKYFINILEKKNYLSFISSFTIKFYILAVQQDMVPAFFRNRASLQEAISGRISRKYQILINFNQISLLPKYYGVFNIFIMPDLYTNAIKSFVRNISYVGFIKVKDNLLQTFR